MGGIVAQLAARRDPSRLGGLVLAATGTGAQRNALEKVALGGFTRSQPLLNTVPEEVGEVVEEQVDDEALRPHAWALRELSSVSLATHRTVIAQVAGFNSTPWLHELTLPVAVVKTTRDLAFPQWIQDEMADLLPHSAVFPIHAGHAETSVVMHLRPELVDMSLAVRNVPEHMAGLEFIGFNGYPVSFGWTSDDFGPSGVIGDPTGAKKKKSAMAADTAAAKRPT